MGNYHSNPLSINLDHERPNQDPHKIFDKRKTYSNEDEEYLDGDKSLPREYLLKIEAKIEIPYLKVLWMHKILKFVWYNWRYTLTYILLP
jgi:hypothetical protein